MTDISPGNVVKLFCNQRCVRHVFFCFSHLKNAKNGFTRIYLNKIAKKVKEVMNLMNKM